MGQGPVVPCCGIDDFRGRAAVHRRADLGPPSWKTGTATPGNAAPNFESLLVDSAPLLSSGRRRRTGGIPRRRNLLIRVRIRPVVDDGL